MKITFISRSSDNTRRLLLIFSGWSTTPEFYADLKVRGWDIAVVTGYDDLTFDPAPMREYVTVYVVAWSLGVRASEMAAEHGLDPTAVTAAFAVNGTLMPLSNHYGIPHNIYRGTEANLDPIRLRKFQARMTNTRDPWPMPSIPPTADDDEILRLRAELRILGDFDRPGRGRECFRPRLPWHKAFMSVEDRIFNFSNQRKCWLDISPAPQRVALEGGPYHPLDRIIAIITPNHEKIGQRFQRALPTYDRYAGPQEDIAYDLARMLTWDAAGRIRDYIEIGPGTGALTRQLQGRIQPFTAKFIDLYPLDRFSLAVNEEYIVGDAETVMESLPTDSADLIASASTIQWFADPARFFANCARVLRPGGILLCSTFIKGNLMELDYLRPSPLHYLSAKDLTAMLCREFQSVVTSRKAIVEHFDSPRHLLLHLKNTGVGGGSRAGATMLMTKLPPSPTLTYRPLLIMAK